jgi:hypothetical protein
VAKSRPFVPSRLATSSPWVLYEYVQMKLCCRAVASPCVTRYSKLVGTEDTAVAAAAYCPASTSARALMIAARFRAAVLLPAPAMAASALVTARAKVAAVESGWP